MKSDGLYGYRGAGLRRRLARWPHRAGHDWRSPSRFWFLPPPKMTEDDVATIGGLLTFLVSRDMLTILLSMAGDDVVGRLLLVASRARLTDAVHDSLQEALYWLGQWHTFENARRARMVPDRWLRRQRRRRGRRAPPLWRHLVSSDSETMEYWPTGSWSEDETSHTDDL